jgi:hypothetical protein
MAKSPKHGTDVIRITETYSIRPWQLADARSATAKRFLADPKIGHAHEVWFRPQDWAADGTLIATGEDRDRALDPWASGRSRGWRCPPLLHWSDDLSRVSSGSLVAVETPPRETRETRETPAGETPSESHDEKPWEAAGVSRATWFRRRDAHGDAKLDEEPAS